MIAYLDLKNYNRRYEPQLSEAMLQTIRSGRYLLGSQVEEFENAFAAFCGASHCIGTANGLDALTLILRAWVELGVMKPGDEVIVPANTFIASILAVSAAGLTPVPVEPDPCTCTITPDGVAAAITDRTRAIMAVHLYGRLCDMEGLGVLAAQNGLKLIEDAAQAHGASVSSGPLSGKRSGSLGDAAGFSFYPGKNLGALGDGGCVTTDDEELATAVRRIANYGSIRKYVNRYKGCNSRLDEIQAAALLVKLPFLESENIRRREIATRYFAGISNPLISLPPSDAGSAHVYHIFAVHTPYRDQLQRFLLDQGIETLIHYPVPPHRQEAYSEWSQLSFPVTEMLHDRELSIPLNPAMTDSQVDQVIAALNSFRL